MFHGVKNYIELTQDKFPLSESPSISYEGKNVSVTKGTWTWSIRKDIKVSEISDKAIWEYLLTIIKEPKFHKLALFGNPPLEEYVKKCFEEITAKGSDKEVGRFVELKKAYIAFEKEINDMSKAHDPVDPAYPAIIVIKDLGEHINVRVVIDDKDYIGYKVITDIFTVPYKGEPLRWLLNLLLIHIASYKLKRRYHVRWESK